MKTLCPKPLDEHDKLMEPLATFRTGDLFLTRKALLPAELQGRKLLNPFRLYLNVSGRHEAEPGSLTALHFRGHEPRLPAHTPPDRLLDLAQVT